MADTKKTSQKDKIKASMKNDINQIQTTADLLSGKGTIGTSKLNSSKKQSSTSPNKVDDPKNLTKFMHFIEKKYAKSLIKVEIKKDI